MFKKSDIPKSSLSKWCNPKTTKLGKQRGPRGPITRRTRPEDSEAAVKKECLEAAKLHGIMLFRQQAGKVLLGSYYMMLAPEGAADLTGIMPDRSGRRLEVETKRRDGKYKQSPEQIEWQRLITEAGGVYIVAHSAKEMLEQIEERREPRLALDDTCDLPT